MAWCLSIGTASNEVRGSGIHSVEASGPTIRKLLHGQDFFCIDVDHLKEGCRSFCVYLLFHCCELNGVQVSTLYSLVFIMKF